MNTKALYAAGGGIAAAAIAIFFVTGSGNIRLPGGQENPAPAETPELQLAIRNINVTKIDERNAKVEVIFSAHNPNTSTAILETIHYTLHVGELQMTSGDIGESPEGFYASQAGIFPIVANSTITLPDSTIAVRNNLTASAWDSMVDNTAHYRVEGTYVCRVTGATFETTACEKDFIVTFP